MVKTSEVARLYLYESVLVINDRQLKESIFIMPGMQRYACRGAAGPQGGGAPG